MHGWKFVGELLDQLVCWAQLLAGFIHHRSKTGLASNLQGKVRECRVSCGVGRYEFLEGQSRDAMVIDSILASADGRSAAPPAPLDHACPGGNGVVTQHPSSALGFRWIRLFPLKGANRNPLVGCCGWFRAEVDDELIVVIGQPALTDGAIRIC